MSFSLVLVAVFLALVDGGMGPAILKVFLCTVICIALLGVLRAKVPLSRTVIMCRNIGVGSVSVLLCVRVSLSVRLCRLTKLVRVRI